MDLINGFLDNLGSKYTAALVAFLTGFIIGQASFLNKLSIIMGLFVGVIFMVVSFLFSTFLETVFADNLTITINIRTVFTVALLALFFYVVVSAPSLNQFIYNIKDGFRA